MAPLMTCVSYYGTFQPTICANKNYLLCKFCQVRKKMLEDLKAALTRIDALTTRLETLQECFAQVHWIDNSARHLAS